MRQLCCCLLAGAITVSPLGSLIAAEFPAADDRWLRLQTTNFTLFSNTSKRATRRIARDLERFRDVLRLFYTKLPERAPVPSFVYVFKSDPSYTPYKPLYGGKPMVVAGVFQQHRDANYISMTTHTGIDPFRLIYHEYMHQLLAGHFPKVPVWFNEGLAEAYSTFTADEDSASIGRTVGDHLLTLRRQPLMPLRELMAVTHESPVYNEGERRGIFYAESWALVHYLMWDSEERKPQLGDYLERLRRGEDPDAAFHASFGVDPEKLEAELRMYLEQRRFSYSRVEFDKRGLETTEEIRPLNRDEVLFHLGDLLAHMHDDRSEEAERYFQEALAVNPSHARSHAGLGFLAVNSARYDQAVRHLEHALTLDSDDPMITFQAASALLWRGAPGDPDPLAPDGRGPSDLQRAQALFRRTILLNPAIAEAYVGYGESIVSGGGEIAPAIKLVEAGWHLLPARTDLVVNLAVLYERNGERDKARYLLREVLPLMGDPNAVRRAARLLPAIDEPVPSAMKEPPGPVSMGTTAEELPPDEAPELSDLDPEAQRALEERWRKEVDIKLHNKQVASYNRAVELANAGALSAAIELLEETLPEIKSEDLKEQTRSLLERMKADFARLKGE